MIRSVRNTCQTFLLFAACGLCSSTATAEQGLTETPPAEYVLTVNGKPITLTDNKPQRAKLRGGNVTLKLTPKPYRTFDKQGVKFQYPTEFAFSFDPELSAVMSWSFTKGDTEMALVKCPPMDTREVLSVFVKELEAEYKGEKIVKSPTTLTLGGKKYSGTKIQIVMDTTHIVQEFIAFKNSRGTFVITIQNISEDNFREQPDTRRIKKLLETTFKLSN